MSSLPSVSVVMPFLDVELYIEESIRSVLAQTRTDWELILVDDGSKDTSREIAEHFASGDPRISVLASLPDGSSGASAARNRGVRAARGRYLAFLDADDIWKPEKLAVQVPLLDREPDAVMLYSNTLYWSSWSGEEGSAALDHLPDLGVVPGTTIHGRDLLSLCVRGLAAVPCTCGSFIRREVAESVGGWDESFRKVYTDQVFFAKVMLAGRVAVADGCWDLYRQHAKSSVQVAARSGELTHTHQRFLSWLHDYLVDTGEGSSTLARVVATELRWLTRPPWQRRIRRMLGTKMLRRGRRVVNLLQSAAGRNA